MKRASCSKPLQSGITLVELMMVLAVLSILAVMAMPSMDEQFRIRRVQGAAEALAGSLQNAKAEAIKKNRQVSIVFTSSAPDTWCFGMIDDDPATTGTIETSCDCTGADATQLCNTGSVVKSDDYKGVSFSYTGSNVRTFNPVRGTLAGSNTFTFDAGNNKTLGVSLLSIGRVRICKPSGSTFLTESGSC